MCEERAAGGAKRRLLMVIPMVMLPSAQLSFAPAAPLPPSPIHWFLILLDIHFLSLGFFLNPIALTTSCKLMVARPERSLEE